MCWHAYAAKFFVEGVKEFESSYSEPKPVWEQTDPEYDAVNEFNQVVEKANAETGRHHATLKFERGEDGKLAWVGFHFAGPFNEGFVRIFDKFQAVASRKKLVVDFKAFLAESSGEVD